MPVPARMLQKDDRFMKRSEVLQARRRPSATAAARTVSANDPRRCAWRLGWLCLVAAMVAAVGAAVAQADTIRVGGFNYGDISVEGVDGGLVFYVNNAGAEVTQVLDQVEWIKLDRLPQFSQGEEARVAGNNAKALRLYKQALSKAQADWEKKLVNWRIFQTAQQTQSAVDAIQAYLNLAQLNAEDYFLSQPPTELASQLPENRQNRMAREIRETINQVQGRDRQRLSQLLAVVEDLQTPVQTPESSDASDASSNDTPAGRRGQAPSASRSPQPSTATTPSTPSTPSSGGGAKAAAEVFAEYDLVLYPRADLPGITDMIANRQIAEARERLVSVLSNPNQLPEKLYLLGMTQLAKAEQSGAPEDYQDAAISFVRIPIHYPTHSFRGPALVEGAYAHLKFGRPDIAERMLDDAETTMDSESYPQYMKRLEQVREQVNQAK